MSNTSIEVMELVGKKPSRQETLFSPPRRETRIGKELRELRSLLDFSWFRNEATDKFCLSNGRPSIAPEVLAAMVFLGYWYDIRSDRQLCDECEDRLSFREFIGLGDEDEVPVHSSFTHWRQRLGRDAFRRFIDYTLQLALEHGLHPGKCRMFDSSLVKAQADATGEASVELDPLTDTNDFLDAFGEWEDSKLEGGCEEASDNGWREKEAKRKVRDRVTIQINSNDVDARLLSKPGKATDFYHKCHFEFDASSGLVINADVGHVPDAVKMVEFLSAESGLVDTVAGDCGYFSIDSQRWLKEHGICSMISVHDKSNNAGRVFGLDAFAYVPEDDTYICPAGQILTRQGYTTSGQKRYQTGRATCKGCELHAYCFARGRSSTQRQLTVNLGRELVDEARKRNLSWRYRRLKVRRSILCEGSIGTMKTYGGLSRARGVGEESMAIQAIMAGAVNNVKKILRHIRLCGRSLGRHSIASLCHRLRLLYLLIPSLPQPKASVAQTAY